MGWRRWAALAACALLASCANGRAVQRPDTSRAPQAAATPRSEVVSPVASPKEEYFVDTENGFRIQRPDATWAFRPGHDLATENIAVPLVIANTGSQAQVVVQVAPAVASPSQFAARLTVGLKARAGFETTDIQPIPLADGAVGFDFEVGDQVHGRVAILDGTEGRVFVLLATWPRGAPQGVERQVDQIFSSMHTAQ
jgi:hypothetical protein